jgi:glycosyltransferase involved in cell wall biosynthesis
MHLVYLLNEFPKLSESFIINEIYGLEQLGHEVSIISIREVGGTVTHDELDALHAEVRYLPFPGVVSGLCALRWCKEVGELVAQYQLLSPRETAGAAYIGAHLNRAIQSLPTPPDHVHAHFFDWPKFALGYLDLDVPMTVTAHAFGLFQKGTHEQRRGLSERVDRIVTISAYNQQYLIETVGVEKPIDIIRMGIRPEKFEPSDSAVPGRLLTVARFVEKKGIEYAVDAVSQLVDDHPDLEYRLIGSGPMEAAIRERIRERRLESHVRLLGRVSDKRLIQELDEATAFVLPCVVAADGDRDGIPVALMEAMAMETVPISTTISGIPELIKDGETGLLCEERNTGALREAIRHVIENPCEMRSIANQARDYVVSEFAAKEQVEKMERIFAHKRTDGGNH